MRHFLITSALAALSACATAPEPPPTVPPPPPCPVVSSSEWKAWVNAMPGPGSRPTLIVTGKVTLPSADWTATFRADARVMESYPVQVVVELDATSNGLGAQVPIVREVRGSWPSEQSVGAVTVMCRGTTLTRISPVETAH